MHMDVEIDAIEKYMRETSYYIQNLRLKKKTVKSYIDDKSSDSDV